MNNYIFYIFLVIISFVIWLITNIEGYMIYYPTKLDSDYKFDNKYIEFDVETIDNEKINCLLLVNPNTESVIIVSHGNAGNILYRDRLANMLSKYASIVLYDYRGYGKSSGNPCEDGLYKDLRAVWKHLIEYKEMRPNNISLYGESLGCSIAIKLASDLCDYPDLKPKCVILQSGFANIKKLAEELVPKMMTYLLSSKFDNEKCVKKIGDKIPIIVGHGLQDELIHYSHAKQLLEANNNIILHTMEGNHNNVQFDDEYFLLIQKYV